MAIVNTSIAPLLKEGSNVTLTQDGQVITIASTGGGGGGTPGGSDTQVQFNDGGSFGGDAGLSYDKTNNILDVESLDFATTPTAAAATYRLNTDDAEGSLNLGLKGGNVNIAVGAEVVIMSYNAEATTLNKGEVVYLYGAQGQRPSVKRADNTSDATSATTFGMVAESIASGGEGFVIQIGVLRNINTNAYNEGDILYLGTSGGVTTTKQYAPNHNVFVGVVLKKNATSGRIFIKPQNGYELDEIHNVSAQSPSDKDIIAYNTSTSLWEKKQLSAIGGVTGTGISGQVAYWSGTTTQTGSSTFTFTPTTSLLVNNSITASGAIARGISFTPALTAAANGDILVGLDINPTYSVGSFIGVQRFSLRVQGTTNTNFFNTGNIGINSPTDSGFKLDINGTARVSGQLNLTADIMMYTNNTGFRVNANTIGILNSSGRDVTDAFLWQWRNIQNVADVTRNLMTFTGILGFNTGTNIISSLNITPTINTNGGINIYRGIYHNPILTTLTGTTHRAIETVSGDLIFGSTSGDMALGTSTLGTSTKLTIGGSKTASSSIARGELINTTLVASANNDILVGLDINPTFTNGAFTDVSNLALRISNGNLSIVDKDIVLSTTTGTKIGTATTQKLGFYGNTPVVQPSSVTTSQGIADALTSLGLLSSSSITTTPDVGGKLYLFNSY